MKRTKNRAPFLKTTTTKRTSSSRISKLTASSSRFSFLCVCLCFADVSQNESDAVTKLFTKKETEDEKRKSQKKEKKKREAEMYNRALREKKVKARREDGTFWRERKNFFWNVTFERFGPVS